MRHLYWGIVTLFLFILKAYSQNPIISHSFTADPTARVFDGKIYLYPSHDIKSPVERLQMVVKVFNAIHGEVEQCSFLRKRLCLIFLEVEQYGTLISQFCKNDLSAQKVRKK